ncbi:MAG TPA: hypothetical protein VIA64_11970 [Burkholderiales bacterium]|jgi:uncharacterized protein
MSAWSRIVLACVLSLAAGQSPAAIDCSRPKSGVDWLLCSNDKVALADHIMAIAFRAAFYRAEDKEALVEDQERWRRTVRDACNDVPCLIRVYQDRTSELETW